MNAFDRLSYEGYPWPPFTDAPTVGISSGAADPPLDIASKPPRFIIRDVNQYSLYMAQYRVLLGLTGTADRADLLTETLLGLPGDHTDLAATVLSVSPGEPVAADGDRDGNPGAETEERTIVTDVTEALERAGVEVTNRLERGDPTERILSVAEEIDADSILMCGRKRTPAGKAVFGSTAQSVLLQAERPVITVLAD